MDFMNLMKNAKSLQEQMANAQSELGNIEVTGQSAGGMVTIRMNGHGALTGLSIDSSLYAEGEKEILEDLLIAAHNDAKEKTQSAMQEQMRSLTQGLGLPADFKLPT